MRLCIFIKISIFVFVRTTELTTEPAKPDENFLQDPWLIQSTPDEPETIGRE